MTVLNIIHFIEKEEIMNLFLSFLSSVTCDALLLQHSAVLCIMGWQDVGREGLIVQNLS